jgi:hypothetical protein
MFEKQIALALSLSIAFVAAGCSSTPAPAPTFLSTYANLQFAGHGESRESRYISPALKRYSAFMIEPLIIEPPRQHEKPTLPSEQQAQVVDYFNQSLAKALQTSGYTVTNQPGPDVARVRVAITSVEARTWRLSGGRGCPPVELTLTALASTEGEVVDSITGKQLAAAIRSAGGEINLKRSSTIQEVKAYIDQWNATAVKRLNELKDS